MAANLKKVKPDAKGRVSLGKLAEGVELFEVEKDGEGRIILTPQATIPQREAWLYRNPEALAGVKRGLEDAAAGRVSKGRDFSEFAGIDID
jgi:hypothetical protein